MLEHRLEHFKLSCVCLYAGMGDVSKTISDLIVRFDGSLVMQQTLGFSALVAWAGSLSLGDLVSQISQACEHERKFATQRGEFSVHHSCVTVLSKKPKAFGLDA